MLRTFLNKLFTSTEKKLEEARLNLEADLREKDMVFLVNTMSSDAFYSPLLERKRSTVISSDDTVSWYGYRRAETLYTDQEKAQLLAIFAMPEYESKKDSIFFCLAHLCKNRTDVELFNFLMHHLENEKEVRSKSCILIGIGDMDKSDARINIEPIKKLAKKRSLDLKTNAILALTKTNDKEVEPLLLELFAATKDSHMKSTICFPLKTIGTTACIPLLDAAYKKTRDSFLRQCIEEVIEEVAKKKTG